MGYVWGIIFLPGVLFNISPMEYEEIQFAERKYRFPFNDGSMGNAVNCFGVMGPIFIIRSSRFAEGTSPKLLSDESGSLRTWNVNYRGNYSPTHQPRRLVDNQFVLRYGDNASSTFS